MSTNDIQDTLDPIPDDLILFCNRQLEEARAGRTTEAALRVRNSLSGVSGNSMAHLLLTLAEIYLIQNNYTEVLETIHIISGKNLEKGRGYFCIRTGRLLSQAGFFEASESWFRKGLSESLLIHEHKRGEFLLGLHLLKGTGNPHYLSESEQIKQGIEFIEKSTDYINDADEACELALLLNKKCDSKVKKNIACAALKTIEKIPQPMLNSLAASLYGRALFLELSGDFPAAEESFKQLSVIPNQLTIPVEDAIIGIARQSVNQGQSDIAFRRLKEGLRNKAVKNPSKLILAQLSFLKTPVDLNQIEQIYTSILSSDYLSNDKSLIMGAARFLVNLDCFDTAISLLKEENLTEDSSTCLILEIELMIANHLMESDKEEALTWFIKAISNAVAYACNHPEKIITDTDNSLWLVPKEYMTTTISQFRNLYASTDRKFSETEKLGLALLLLKSSPRQARSLLRQAATSDNVLTATTALLLIAYLQLPVDPEIAYGTLQTALSIKKDHKECQSAIYYLFAMVCEKTGRYKSIYKNLLKAEELAIPSVKSIIQTDIGRYWLRQEEPLRALGLFRQAIIHPLPQTTRIIENLRGNGLEMAGDLQTAIHTYRIMKNCNDQPLKLHSILCLAGIYARQGDAKKAIILINSFSDLPLSQKRLVSMIKGRIYQIADDHTMALKEFDEAIWPTFPELSTCLKLRGISLEALGDKRGAVRSYIVSLVETEYSTRNCLPGEASTLPRLFIPELAKIQLSRLKEITWLEQKIKQYATFLFISKDSQVPEDDYNGVSGLKKGVALLLNPSEISLNGAYTLLSEIYSEMGRKKVYRDCIKKADLSCKDRFTSLISSKEILERKIDVLEKENLKGGGKLTEISSFFPSVSKKRVASDYISYSIDDMKKVVEESEGKEKGQRLFNLGNALFDQRKFTEAAEKYTEALLCPRCEQDSEIRHNLGITLNELGDHKWAVECFEKAISSGNESLIPSCLYNMGNALLEQGMIQESLDSYEKCVKYKQSSSDLWLHALINIAHCNERLGDKDKAKRCLFEALGETRQPGWIMLRLAALEVNSGNISKARNWKKQARDEFLKNKDIFGISKLEEVLKGIDC